MIMQEAGGYECLLTSITNPTAENSYPVMGCNGGSSSWDQTMAGQTSWQRYT